MAKKTYLTTIDNPYNPHTDFISWYKYDMTNGYNSCGKLARLTNITEDMTEKEENDEIEKAINRLVEIDPLDIFIKYEIEI